MGCKNTILAYKTDRVIPATFMGNNCAPLLFEIAKNKDLTITLEYLMKFDTCSDLKHTLRIQIKQFIHIKITFWKRWICYDR